MALVKSIAHAKIQEVRLLILGWVLNLLSDLRQVVWGFCFFF